MKKFLRTLMLAALMLPFVSQAQSDCTPISTFPVTYGFEASEGFTTTVTGAAACTTNVFNTCWRNEETSFYGSTGSGRIWHIYGGTTASQIHNGAHSLMLPDKGSSSLGVSTTMLTFPAMNFTSAAGYVVSFWIYRNGTGTTNPEGFKIYVSPTDTIGPNAVELGHYSRHRTMAYPTIESTNGWYQYETSPITMTGTVYLIFEGQSYYGSSTYIDDIVIEETPTCFKVTDLAIDDTLTTSNSLTLTWTDTRNTGATYVIYDMSDTSVVASGVTGTTYTATGLTANTAYTFAVMTNCGAGDVTDLTAPVSGRTACVAMELPWTCGFEAEEIQSTTQATALPWCSYRSVDQNATYPNYPYSYSSSTYAHSGSRSLYFYGTTSTSYPAVMAFVLPQVDVALYPMNLSRLTFWGRSSSTSYDKKVYVATTTDPTFSSGSGINIVDSVMVTGTTHTLYSIPLGAAIATDPYVMILVERGSGNLYIDDMTLEEMPACLEVSNVTIANTTTNSVTITWNANAANTSASYSIYNMADTSLVATGISDTFYTVNNLQPATQYIFGVEANCPLGDASIMTATGYTACAPIAMPFTENFDNSISNHPCWSGANQLASEVFAGAALNVSTVGSGYWNYSTTQNGFTNGHYYNNIYGTTRKGWLITPAIDLSNATTAQLSFDMALTAYSGSLAAPAQYTGGQKFMVIISTDGGNTWLESNATVWMHADSVAAGAADYSFSSIPYSQYGNYVISLNQYIGDTIKIAFYGQSTVSGGDNDFHIDNIAVTEEPSCLPVSAMTVGNITTNGATISWTGNASSYVVYDMSDTSVYQTVTADSIVLNGLTSATQYTFGVAANCGNTESDIVSVSFSTLCGSIAIPFTEDFEIDSPTLGCWSVSNITSNTGLTTTNPYSGNIAFCFYYNTNPPQYLISPELSGTETGVKVSFMYRVQSATYPESFQLGYSTTTNDLTAFTWGTEQTNLINTTYQQYSEILPAGTKYVSIKYTANDMYILFIDSVVFDNPPSCLPVTDLAVDSVTATSVFLSWTGNASSYSIYSSTGAVVATGITTTSYEVTGLTPSTSYTFGVIANCGSDNSEAVIISAVTECGGTTCFVEINGTDSYGDGWNGNAINLIQNGAVIHTFTLTSGSTLSEHITVCGDYPVNFAWVSGSYADEVFFELKDASGMVVYTCNDATALTDDTVFYTLTTVCPSCAAPVITVDNATETSITISWTGNAASYDVYNGSTYVASVTTNTYTFTGLSTATTYTFGVQAICSTTDSSAINSITVMTSCGDITTLPYFEGFENGLGCWTTVNGSSDGQPWSVNNCADLSTVDPHGGNYVASSWSWSSSAMHADAWLISPKFILPNNVTDSLMFSWWEIANPSYPDSYSVLISTSTSDTSAFTVIRPSTAAAGTWTMQSIDLTSYAGQSVYVAFHHVDYDENYLLIDDITMSIGSAPVITDSAHITIAVNDPTMGTTIPAPGTYAYADGEEFTITAVPANGYQLLDWAVTVTYDGETETEYLGTTDLTISDTAYAYFDMLNLVVTAIFGTDSIDPNADSMLVNIAVNDPTMGTTNPAPGAHYFHVGEQASVVAIPNNGYHLEGWTVNVTIEGVGTVMDTTLPYAINDFFDIWGGWEVEEGDGMYIWSVTANFAAGNPPAQNDSLTIITSVNNPAWGTVTPAPGTHYYVEGETVVIGAEAYEGYYIYAVYSTVTIPGFGSFSDTTYAEDLGDEVLYDTLLVDEDYIGMTIELNVVFAPRQGIENAEEVNINVYGNEGDIVLQGAEGREVYIFDVNGRMLHHTATANMTERYSVPATGVYLVKVEGVVTKRVVIVR